MSEPREPTTIRSHLRALIDLHQPYPMDDKCIECHQRGPCPSREHASNALAQLDNAPCYTTRSTPPRMDAYGSHRLVADPEPTRESVVD
jgi:hypothetical protein